jgi:hypothetical protein
MRANIARDFGVFRITTLLYNRLNYVIKVNYFLKLFNYFLTAVSANYVFIQPAPAWRQKNSILKLPWATPDGAMN